MTETAKVVDITDHKLKEARKATLEQTVRACQAELQAMDASLMLLKLRRPQLQMELQEAIKEYNSLETSNGPPGN